MLLRDFVDFLKDPGTIKKHWISLSGISGFIYFFLVIPDEKFLNFFYGLVREIYKYSKMLEIFMRMKNFMLSFFLWLS